MKIVIELQEELYRYMMGETYDEHLDRRFDFMIRNAVKHGDVLSSEPGKVSSSKTRGDCIRRMSDEDLVMTFETDCNRCARSENCELRGDPVDYGICVEGNLEWLRQEVNTDDVDG